MEDSPLQWIDSHMHVDYHGLDAAAVVAEMDRFQIERAWILTWYIPRAEDVPSSHRGFSPLNQRADGTHAGSLLSDVLAACRLFPERLVAGYCPCPSEGNASAYFEAAYHTHGVRVCGEWSYRMLLDDPRSIELFRTAGSLSCPVVLHLDVPYLPDEKGVPVYQPHWYGGMPGPLERALQACPDPIFVGHAPGFWRYISGDAERDSALYPDGPIVEGRAYSPHGKHTTISGLISLLDRDWGRCGEILTTLCNFWSDFLIDCSTDAMRRAMPYRTICVHWPCQRG